MKLILAILAALIIISFIVYKMVLVSRQIDEQEKILELEEKQDVHKVGM